MDIDTPDRTESDSENDYLDINNEQDITISEPSSINSPRFSGIDDIMNDRNISLDNHRTFDTEAFIPSSYRNILQIEPIISFPQKFEQDPEELEDIDIFSDDDNESIDDDNGSVDNNVFEFELSSTESEEEDFTLLLWKALSNNMYHSNLLYHYTKVTEKRSQLLFNHADKTNRSGNTSLYTKAKVEQELLEQEKYTWNLVYNLEKSNVTHLDINNINSIERTSCILKWLENIGKDKVQSFTLESTKQSIIGTELEDTICGSKMENNNLSGEDFFKQIWVCIRSGEINAAKKFCHDSKHFWEFGSIFGGDITQFDSNSSWNGDPHRNIWKYSCWKLSEQTSFSEYERAIYASCCGNLLQMFKVCTTWQDYLWACFKTLIDSYKDIHKSDNYVSPDILYNEPTLPLSQGATCTSIKEIFTQLQNNNIKTLDIYEIIQALIIKQDYSSIFIQLVSWSKEGKVSHQLLRFGIHLFLFYQSKGIQIPIKECDIILKDYINYLISQFKNEIPPNDEDNIPNEDSFRFKKVKSIALYTSQLSDKNDSIEVFARFLAGINANEEEKEIFWTYACDTRLDRENITSRIFSIIAEENKNHTNLQNENYKKLQGLQWLCLDVNQRDKAIIAANKLLREFLLQDDYYHANILVSKILPEDTLFTVINNSSQFSNSLNACREYFCLELYLSCQKIYQTWNEIKNNSIETIGDVATAVHKDTQDKKLSGLSNQFINLSNILLKFPPNNISDEFYMARKYQPVLSKLNQKGWLIDEIETNNNERDNELLILRGHCIPKIVMELEDILSYNKEYCEILRIADWITDARWNIYKNFSKEQLQILLKQIRQASLQILTNSKDPIGMKIV